MTCRRDMIQIWFILILQKGLWKRIEETPEQVAERVTQAMHEHYAPVMRQATTARLERRRAKEMAETAKRAAERLRDEQAKRETAEQELQRYRELFTDGLTPDQCRELIDLVQFMREQNIPIEPVARFKHQGISDTDFDFPSL